MKNAKKGSKNDDAVSPVIGVILMVAITVILAAVIAAYVFGMGGNLPTTYMVGAVVSQVSDDQIDVTYMGGPDDDSVDYITVRITTSDGTEIPPVYLNGTPGNAPSPGSISIISPGNFTYNDHVMVIATFLGGNQQVIMDVRV
jgi:flagellin-like protein